MRSTVLRAGAAAALAVVAVAGSGADAGTPGWAPTLPMSTYGQRVTMSAFGSGTVVAAVNQTQIVRSENGGLVWRPTLSEPQTDGAPSTLLSMATPRVGFAANGNAMSRTSDGGDSWELLAPPNATKTKLETFEAVAAVAPNTAVAAKWGHELSENCPVPLKTTPFLRTVNGDKTWKRTDVALPGFPWSVKMADRSRGVALVYVMNYTDPEIDEEGRCQVTGSSNRMAVLVTRDGGATWRRAMTCPAICWSADWTGRTVVVGGNDGTLFTSTDDGQRFRRSGRVFTPSDTLSRLEALAFTSPRIGYALVRGVGIFATADAGKTWREEASLSPQAPGVSVGTLAAVGSTVVGASSYALLARATGPVAAAPTAGATRAAAVDAPAVPRLTVTLPPTDEALSVTRSERSSELLREEAALPTGGLGRVVDEGHVSAAPADADGGRLCLLSGRCVLEDGDGAAVGSWHHRACALVSERDPAQVAVLMAHGHAFVLHLDRRTRLATRLRELLRNIPLTR